MVRYRGMDVAVLRASARGGPPRRQDWPDLTGETPEHVREWRAWLRRAWGDEELAEAIEVASPALATAVREIDKNDAITPARVRRAVESVMSYLLRMTTRPTPFGLFAGVAPVTFGDRAQVRWGDASRPVARPDARWLSELVSVLEADPAVLGGLTVVANTLAFVRGERLVVPCQPRTDESGAVTLVDIEVRHSGPVRAVLRAAQDPRSVADLVAVLAVDFPETPRQVVDRMLTQLVATGVLISGLRPPADVTDPVCHLTERLRSIPEAGRTSLRPLEEISQLLRSYSSARTARERTNLRAAATAGMMALHERPAPLLAADLALDAGVVLPPVVVREAATAVAALVRLAPAPFGGPGWRRWHGRFLERSGPGAVVPLGEVVDADRGLGFPDGYRRTAGGPSAEAAPARDRVLLRLAQRAVLNGEELVLDNHTIADLAVTSETAGELAAVAQTELRFVLQAVTPRALDRGDFTLVVASAARSAGTSIGRFLYLFDRADRDHIGSAFASVPTLNPGARAVQVSCPALMARSQHLVRTPALLPMLRLGEHQPPTGAKQIDVGDLAVTGDANRLQLVSLSTGQVVEPISLHALDFQHATQPLARFLSEITTALVAPCVPFSWGAARALPVLPRVRFGRSILRPASWTLTSTDLPGRQAPQIAWERAWERLREAYRIPAVVYVGERDIVVRLDVSEPAHRALLRSRLNRDGATTLTEAPDSTAFGWIDGRPHEIALPLIRADPPPAPTSVRRHRPVPIARLGGHLPGTSPVLYARLYGNPRRQAEILTAHLPELLDAWPHTRPEARPALWHLRHDSDPAHLGLWIGLTTPDAYGDAARHLGTWAESLRRAGLLHTLELGTYRPEIGRYGTGRLLAAAEGTFAADSGAALAQLTLIAASSDLDVRAVAAVSMVDLAEGFLGDWDAAARWLTDHVPHGGSPRLPRDLREQGLRLLTTARAELTTSHGPLNRSWAQRRHIVHSYRRRLDETAADDVAPDLDEVLASLLQLHHGRMIGLDVESERFCLRLARAIVLTSQLRTPEPADRGSPR
ncbi:lantibiotic dehydratase [Pseudofrankia sp. DC12]|uniref:lantibiotic dehydratase n=1 Tax=Pseudofrankia sp. DC12 TaxID=683315 RepID=UPI0005F8438C|nr:lantibiotic dehydratase [Pseudofrankia sp. DC12]